MNSVICRNETELKPVNVKKTFFTLESLKRKPSVSRECRLETYNVQLLDFYMTNNVPFFIIRQILKFKYARLVKYSFLELSTQSFHVFFFSTFDMDK